MLVKTVKVVFRIHPSDIPSESVRYNRDMTISIEKARKARDKAVKLFKRFGHVNGVGITRKGGDYAVKVNFEALDSKDSSIPDEIDGVPVVLHVLGAIRKQLG